MNREDEQAQGSELSDGLGQFTLLTMRVPEPFDAPTGERLFRIVVTFARKSAVKFNRETLETTNKDIKESYIVFRAGQDLSEFANNLRSLADYLDGQA